MAYALLATRNGEAMQLYSGRPETCRGVLYQVCLVPIGLPCEINTECKPYTVVCLHQYPEGEWGWIALDPQTKDDIGNYILESNQTNVEGKWLFMDLYTEDEAQGD